MKKEIYQECMDYSIKWLRVVGCWPKWSQKNKKSERIYYCYTLAMSTILFIYTFILAYGLTVHYKEWKTLDEAVEDTIVFATSLIVIFKVILFLWNQNELQEVIEYINFNLNERQLTDDEEKSVIQSCIKHEKSLTKTYVFFGYCITILYTTSSIVRILKLRSSDTNQYTLPLKYPFHPKGFPWYYITYGHQMSVMILNGHIGTVADTFFSCLTYYVTGHFKIIQNRISKGSGIVSKEFVLYHNEIIRLVGTMQSIFSRFLFFQLMSSSLLICLGLFQITRISSQGPLHYAKSIIYVTIKLSQLFLYCWYGHEIIEKSVNVSYGVYFGTWFECHKRSTYSNTKMILHRVQKPVQIRAGNYFIVSLPTLASVMNAAYSFFTMLKTMQK